MVPMSQQKTKSWSGPASRAPSRCWVNALLAACLTGLVRLYQMTLSPLIYALFGRVCRFEPSCSQYFIDAVRKYGPWKGSLKGIWRICRCNPFCEGGHDPA